MKKTELSWKVMLHDFNSDKIVSYDVLKDNDYLVDRIKKQFAKEHNLKQTNISYAIKNNTYHGDWKFELIQEIDVKDSSAYQNQISNLDGIIIKNICTNEIKKFKTIKDMKDFVGCVGHDINQYIIKNHILMDKWKIIK